MVNVIFEAKKSATFFFLHQISFAKTPAAYCKTGVQTKSKVNVKGNPTLTDRFD